MLQIFYSFIIPVYNRPDEIKELLTSFLEQESSISFEIIIVEEGLDHVRIETRKCSITTDFQFIEKNNKWKNLKTVVRIESTREFKNSKKPTENAVRYYISSLKAEAIDFQKAIRSHWSIENKLHWTLDVAFSEDASRKRTKNASQNFRYLIK